MISCSLPTIIIGKNAINVNNNNANNNNNKISLVLVRVTKDASKPIAMSKPCIDCLSFLKTMNITSVYYTNDNGEISHEYVNNMSTTHTCRKVRIDNIRLSKTINMLNSNIC